MEATRFKAVLWVGIAVLLIALIALWLSKRTGESRRVEAAAVKNHDLRCLALTLYWEARGQTPKAMRAVGWVVLNRRDHPEFPETICRVVRDGGENPPCQFSYWCDGRADAPTNEDAWKRAQKIASELLHDPTPDPTKGALYFHAADLKPPWSAERKRVARVGDHIFYR
jgi:spore germination cell wall hydrolase CwlJ-like protein